MATATHAQDDDALSIKVGEADLTPIVRIDYLSNSNAFLTPTEEIETTGFLVAPSLTLRAVRRLLQLEVGYTGAYASFSEGALNYDDHRLFADIEAELDSRRRVSGSASIAKVHEELGRGLTRGSATSESEQVESIQTVLDGNFTFGARLARGNIVAGLRLFSEAFQTRSDLTEGSDFTRITPYTRFSYRLSQDTRALLELRFSLFNFDNESSDRSDLALLTGLAFRGTGRTGGNAAIGITTANYEDDQRDSESILSANVNVFFLPTVFSRINLRYQRDFDNVDTSSLSSGQDQTVSDTFSLGWNHQWSSFLSTRAFVTLENRSRDCPTDSTSTRSGAFEVGLTPRRWIEFGAGLRSAERTDDVCPENDVGEAGLEFERQFINAFVRVTL